MALLLLRNTEWNCKRSGADRQNEYSVYRSIFLFCVQGKIIKKIPCGTCIDGAWNTSDGDISVINIG